MKMKLFFTAVLFGGVFVNFSCGEMITKAEFAEKLKTGRTVQMSSRKPCDYYRDRSAESIVSEIEANGFDGVYLMVSNEKQIDPELIEEFHKRGIAVGAMFFATCVYASTDIFPEGWEKWKMEFTVPKTDGYFHLSFVYPDYIQWYKERLVEILGHFDFDGFTFVEAFYPVYDGVNKDPVEFGDVSEGFQAIFKKETGNKFFPNFNDPDDRHYFRTDTKLYDDLIEFRVKTIVDFYGEIVNGPGGVREKFPDIVVAGWTLAVDLEDGPAKLREWEGNDAEMQVRAVKPDIHFLQTHWPDWIKPESKLPADYVKKYAAYIAQAKAADPDVLIGVQADLGSLDFMRKSAGWYKDFIKACGEIGIDSTTYCVWDNRGEIYFDTPVLKKVTGGEGAILKLHFDQYLNASNEQLMQGRVIFKIDGSLRYRVEKAAVDGSILVLHLDKPAAIGTRLFIPVGGVCDVPAKRVTRSGDPGPMHSITEGTNIEMKVEQF